MNLANKLTVSRIFLTFVFMFFLFAHGAVYKILALATFILAAVTDALDGLIAKRTNTVTDFGKLMDPIADKILVLAAFLAFVEMKLIPAWMVVIIMFREFLITGLRLMAVNKGKVISADEGGRHKTVSQMAAIFVVLLFLIFKEFGAKDLRAWNISIYTMTTLAVILTVISGISFLVKNRSLYLNAK